MAYERLRNLPEKAPRAMAPAGEATLIPAPRGSGASLPPCGGGR
jgi:hypothetical protein